MTYRRWCNPQEGWFSCSSSLWPWKVGRLVWGWEAQPKRREEQIFLKWVWGRELEVGFASFVQLVVKKKRGDQWPICQSSSLWKKPWPLELWNGGKPSCHATHKENGYISLYPIPVPYQMTKMSTLTNNFFFIFYFLKKKRERVGTKMGWWVEGKISKQFIT